MPFLCYIIDMERDLFKILTGRELEICELLLRGFNKREICLKLFISMNTVKSHTNNIYKKLEVHSQLELIKRYSQFFES